MRALVSYSVGFRWNSQYPSPCFLSKFPSLSRENANPLGFSHRNWLWHPKLLTFCSSSATSSVNYGGWDDPRLGFGSVNSGESHSHQLRSLLNSLGIDDRKYMFVFLLGFVCALAVSRVRVSSIVLFPACTIALAVGFSIGFVNGGHLHEFSFTGDKKSSKYEKLGALIEKLRKLVDLFNGFDCGIVDMRNGIRRSIDCNHITVSDLESYAKVMESISLSALNGRNIVEDLISSLSVGNQEVERTSYQTSSRRRKEVSETSFDPWHFVGGLFRANSAGSKPSKLKDTVRRDRTSIELNDQKEGNVLSSTVGEKLLSSAFQDAVKKEKVAFYEDAPDKRGTVQDRIDKLINEDKGRNVFTDSMSFSEKDGCARRVLVREANSYQNSRSWFMNNHRIPVKKDYHNVDDTLASHDDFLDLVDAGVSVKHMEIEALFEQEQVLHKANGNYRLHGSREADGKEANTSNDRQEWDISHDDPLLTGCWPGDKNDAGSEPSSMVSDDMLFNGYLVEANTLVKQARECLRVNGDERHAEAVLHRSAKLLSKAIDMKPMSLLAVGQLGNTYLLHGELKLKISHELRAKLARSDPLSSPWWGKAHEGPDNPVASKDKIASVLVNVCEECEDLLVEAGRKYRLALSIDGEDMRALYNWGLALSFRGQLIADIGPEAAFDADKVFLAAIDKFDAMIAKSDVHAPDALFRWGVALQQRSRLRPRNSKDKMKLLEQAKRLYEDALDMDSNNLQAREALYSCMSELEFRPR